LAQTGLKLLIRGPVHDTPIVSSEGCVFQEICGGIVITNYALMKIHRDLLFALESARTRLAIAIAAETKSTPRDQRQYYLETTDRMRRFIRRMRKSGFTFPPRHTAWIPALNALRQIPSFDKAQRLCQVLSDIVTELE